MLDLYNKHTFSDGRQSEETMHSMVMIGGHEDAETGKVSFLLQNWWEGKYFIEVDSQYLASTCCQIVQVFKSAKVGIKDTFETTDAVYAEGYAPMESCSPMYNF